MLHSLKGLATDPAEIRRLDQIEHGIAAYYATGERLYQFMVDKQFDQAHALSTSDAQAVREQLIQWVREEVDQSSAEMRHADGEADALHDRTFGSLAALSLSGLIVALLMVIWITTRFIVRPLTKITAAMGKISNGDFAIAIDEADRDDEIGILGRALTIFRERSLALRVNTEKLKTAHDDIRGLNAVLEQRVEERTAALQEAHRELLAQERLSSLGQLTASVAHELRNPQSTLRNTMHTIQHIAQTRAIDIERQVNRCQRTIDRCDGIVGDLLDFAATRELRAAATRLDVWLGGLLDNAKVPPGIALVRQFDAPLAVVPIDSDRLRCAIVNLIDNAATAIADAPDLVQQRITVATTMGDQAAVVVITDTGPGMTASVLERVFEPLFSTRAFGTGLGLPTVKQIVEQHGGSIAITSATGAGTCIELRLPLFAGKTAAGKTVGAAA